MSPGQCPQCGTDFNVGTWSMTGAHFDETVASKPPVDPSLPAAAMEQTDRKSLRPESRCRYSIRDAEILDIFLET